MEDFVVYNSPIGDHNKLPNFYHYLRFELSSLSLYESTISSLVIQHAYFVVRIAFFVMNITQICYVLLVRDVLGMNYYYYYYWDSFNWYLLAGNVSCTMQSKTVSDCLSLSNNLRKQRHTHTHTDIPTTKTQSGIEIFLYI